MAEYVKFRVSAAKVGVSMALMALIAGVAEKIQAAPAQIRATPAAATNFLKLQGISGNTKSAFIKLEMKYYKLQSALSSVENTLAHKYLKIRDANAQFLKITDANDKWLKISDANDKWLKIADANAEFLKIDDANQRFMKLGSTAANSELLGNLAPSAFFQGHGNVVSGAVSVSPGQQQQVVATPGGAVSILIGLSQPGAGPSAPSVTIRNNTGALLPAVQDTGNGQSSTTASKNLAPGDTTIGLSGGTSQLHLQTFPASGGGFNSIIAVLVSLEPDPSGNGGYLASAQMLNGAG